MRIIVADDEPNLLSSMGTFLTAESIDTVLSPDGAKAKTFLSEESFDAAVLDIRMPGLDGISLLRWIKDEGLTLPVIMMSAHGDVRDAVEAMRLGACDYLVKPFDPDELLIRLRKAVRDRRLTADREVSRRPAGERLRMIGSSPAVVEALRLIDRAGPTPSTVLITGESGSGKEVAARLVHERSGRPGSFVAVNLGAIPDTLLESELFGYEKGAFTGAADRKLGLFELADGGTLFLDELGEMPQHMQVKILRAIQERKVTRLGGTKGIPVDTRIIAATNRDLEAMVAKGTFREDLYYRINVVRIHLPPLRERPGDAVSLARHFVEALSTHLGRKGAILAPDALALIAAYPFPGNVRELSNAVERALILSDGDNLHASDFQLGSGKSGPLAASPSHPGPLSGGAEPFVDQDGKPYSLAELERRAILASIGRNQGKRETSASELGITRRTLFNKLNGYGYRD
ncbi:MAG: sigma-54-dependent Fis family transcriptional regulator [Spirochaetae bacterium HGW-Spirochaetae-7]|jgi:two-component system response regulator AtoC|nr:MAG: sigma-54-dependent Fis family transcriptional regulator [Spirochaetae bacterium HGW-Spirochaetae-7]